MTKTDSEVFQANLAREWYIALGSGLFLFIVFMFDDQTIIASGIMVGGFLILNLLVLLGKTRVNCIQVDRKAQLTISLTKMFFFKNSITYDLNSIAWKSKKRISFRGLRFKQVTLFCNGDVWKISSNRLGWTEPEVDRLEAFLKKTH